MKLCVAKTRFRIFEIKVVLALLADLANLCVKEPERGAREPDSGPKEPEIGPKEPDRGAKEAERDCSNDSPSRAIVSLEPFRGKSSQDERCDKFESMLQCCTK